MSFWRVADLIEAQVNPLWRMWRFGRPKAGEACDTILLYEFQTQGVRVGQSLAAATSHRDANHSMAMTPATRTHRLISARKTSPTRQRALNATGSINHRLRLVARD